MRLGRASQPGKLPGGDLDTLPDVLGEPAGRADGALVLLTPTAVADQEPANASRAVLMSTGVTGTSAADGSW